MKRIICAAWAGLVVTQGAAQTVESSTENQEPDVIIVTGVGLGRIGGEMITSTAALDKADIIENLSGGLGDTLEHLPGVTSTSFGPGASRPVIRGLGAERVQVLTNGIGVIDASAASPDHAVTGDPLGAERIEVLRGPASLAYGGGASGGVVNVIDGLIATTPGETRLDLYGGYTSVDEGTTLAGRGIVGAGPMTVVVSASSLDASDIDIPGYAESERIRALEEAEHAENGGEEDEAHEEEAVGTLPNSFSRKDSLAAGLSFSGDNGYVGVSIRQLDSTYGIVGHSHGPEGETTGEGGGEEHGEESPFVEMAQTRYDIAGGAYFGSGFFSEFRGAVSGVDYQHVEFEGTGVPGTTFNNNGVEGRAELLHDHANGVNGSWGMQASRRDFEALGDESFITPTQTRQAGVFVFEQAELNEVGFEGGVRFDRVNVDNSITGERRFDTFNASAGLHGHATENLFLGASVSRTERAPTDVELFADGPHLATSQFERGNANLRTETGINVELTARWDAGPLKAGVNVFRYDFSDFIYLAAIGAEQDGLPVFEFTQADAVFTGGELTASFELGDAAGMEWSLDGSLDMVGTDLEGGGTLPRIPPMSAAAGLVAQSDQFKGRFEVQWADAQDEVGAFELPTDSYVTADLTFAYDLNERVTFIVQATNITDEEIRIHASPLKDLAPLQGRSIRTAIKASF